MSLTYFPKYVSCSLVTDLAVVSLSFLFTAGLLLSDLCVSRVLTLKSLWVISKLVCYLWNNSINCIVKGGHHLLNVVGIFSRFRNKHANKFHIPPQHGIIRSHFDFCKVLSMTFAAI